MKKNKIGNIFIIYIALVLFFVSVMPSALSINEKENDKKENKIGSLLDLQLKYKINSQKINEENNNDNTINKKVEYSTDTNKQKIFLYFCEKPDLNQIQELEQIGVNIQGDSWIPPIGNHPTGFLIAEAPVEYIEEIANKDFIHRIETAEQTKKAHNDIAAIATNVEDVWDFGFDGSGITIAVLDSGLDTNHPDIPTPVESYDYAEEDNTIGNTVTGHGTHVTATALGRGTQSEGTYNGSAYNSNLVFLKIGLDSNGRAPDDAIVNAMHDAVDDYDADIITISYGGWSEYHDGSSSIAQAADYAYSEGAVVFCSSGNDADNNQHYSNTVNGNSITDYIRINIDDAGTDDTSLAFNLVWFDGMEESRDLDIEYFDNSYNLLGDVTVSAQTESPRGTESIYSHYDFYLPSGDSTYYLRIGNNDEENQFFHLYYDSSYNEDGAGDVNFENPDPFFTIGSPATADNATSIGSYTTRENWDNFLGNTYSYGENENTVSSFSSRGPRVDNNGSPKPDLLAPGSAIISARDQDVYPWIWPDSTPENYYPRIIDNDDENLDGSGPADYFIMQGTSMATPHAAGISALLIDAYPELDGNPSAINHMLELVASNNGLHDNTEGYGLIDAYSCIDPIVLGLTWLCEEQNPTGSWTYSGRITEENVGLSSLAILSFLNFGIDEEYPTVKNGINWILSKQKSDGKICNGFYDVYDTSLATLALSATHNMSYYDEIQDAVSFLCSVQNDEGEGYSSTNKHYGGWPYYDGMTNWADLSNSQFVLLGIYYAELFNPDDTIIPNDVWEKAETYVTRCQNRESSNPNFNFYDDGGFIYGPGSTTWAGGQSYGSMTTAGLWGLYTTGVSRTDGRVQDAWTWIQENYYINQNYPLNNLFLYYYLYGLAKACILWEVETIGGHDWYDEMIQELENNQEDDGHWIGTDDHEEPDNVATCWALLAMESKKIPENTGLSFEAECPLDLHVYDPKGRHVGINYNTGDIEIEIPEATYTGPDSDPEIVHIENPIAGTYTINLIGTGEGSYTYTVKGWKNDLVISEESYSDTISLNEIRCSETIVSALAGAITHQSNAHPVADANGPYTMQVGIELTLDATNSYDPDGNIQKYEWDLDNDGEFDDEVGPIPTVTWNSYYSGPIHLKVTDKNGGIGIDTSFINPTSTAGVPVLSTTSLMIFMIILCLVAVITINRKKYYN